MAESFNVLVTSERYGVDSQNNSIAFEQQQIAGVTDLDIDLRSIVCTGEDELIEAAQPADALLASTRDAITRRVVSSLPRCKVIARYGVGLDNVDLDAAAEHGIVITHYPSYCTAEVADHAMSMILASNRRIVEQDRALREGAWAELGIATRKILRGPIMPLRELTLGVIGFGRIGQAVAARAKPFGMTLITADPYADQGVIDAADVRRVELDELLSTADLITVHCPLTPETRGMLGAEQIARMKPTAFLINTARGPIVDLDAITDALRRETIAGAGLDVVYPEPLPAEHPLHTLPNVMLTPHSAYYSERSVETVRRETLNSALDVLRGRRPGTIANPAVLDRVSLQP